MSEEALARIEHKLDILLTLERDRNPSLTLPQMGDSLNLCPVCGITIKYLIDIVAKKLLRRCGCKTGKYPPIDLEQFAPPKNAGGGNKHESGITEENWGTSNDTK